MHWKRQDIKDLLADLNCTITEKPPGGDYDITGLTLVVEGVDDAIIVAPYKNPDEADPGAAQDYCDIHAVEVCNQKSDSAGGCNSTNEAIATLYGVVCARLRGQGFGIINHYNEIF